MGGDGGSIPKRGDVVKTAGMRFARNLGGMGYLPNTQVLAGSDKFNTVTEKQLRWTTCAVSQEPLRPPLLGCRLGQIYNKESVLKRLLLLKTQNVPLPENMSHIKSLKDLKNLKVEFENSFLVCPISKSHLSVGSKGLFLWSCGCVFGTKAYKAIKTCENNVLLCPVCDKPYDPIQDVVHLVLDHEEMQVLKQKILQNKNSSCNQQAKRQRRLENAPISV